MQLLSTEGRGRCQTRTPAKLNAAALLQGEIPSSVRLPLLPFVPDLSYATELLFLTSALSPMEVPTRSIYVIATVTPAERPVTASITSVPRSLASAVGPVPVGWMPRQAPVCCNSWRKTVLSRWQQWLAQRCLLHRCRFGAGALHRALVTMPSSARIFCASGEFANSRKLRARPCGAPFVAKP